MESQEKTEGDILGDGRCVTLMAHSDEEVVNDVAHECKTSAHPRSKDEKCHIRESERNWLETLRVHASDSVDVAGLKYVCGVEVSRARRNGWLVVLLVTVTLLAAHIGSRCRHYTSRPVTVDIDIERAYELVFPKITICNYNEFARSKVENKTAVDDLLKAHVKTWISGTASPLNDEDLKVLSEMNTSNVYMDLSLNLNDTFISIKFADKTLSTANVTNVLTSDGACFQLNSDPTNLLKAKLTGRMNGLRLILDIQQSEYYYGALDVYAAGLKVYMNSQDHPALLNEIGSFSVMPGTRTFVGVSLTKRQSVRPPYGRCGEKKLKYFQNYSRIKCNLECETDYITELCGCKSPYMPGPFPVCDPLTQSLCVLKNIDTVRMRYDECNCPVDCQYSRFLYTLSTTTFPSLFWTDLMVEHSWVSKPGINSTYVRNNICAIDIYFESMDVTTMKQHIAYTQVALLSDIGGAMGFWFGSSLLTLYQVIDLLAFTYSRS